MDRTGETDLLERDLLVNLVFNRLSLGCHIVNFCEKKILCSRRIFGNKGLGLWSSKAIDRSLI